jgi:hypothetical protein
MKPKDSIEDTAADLTISSFAHACEKVFPIERRVNYPTPPNWIDLRLNVASQNFQRAMWLAPLENGKPCIDFDYDWDEWSVSITIRKWDEEVKKNVIIYDKTIWNPGA